MTPPIDDARSRLLRAFRMPPAQTMTSRKTSITNAFVSAIIPSIKPSLEEIAEALSILRMDPSDLRCAYCGDRASEWDHLRRARREAPPDRFHLRDCKPRAVVRKM